MPESMNRPTLEGASQIVGHASDTVSPRNRDFSLRRFRIGKGGIGFSPPGEIARSSLVVPDDYPVAFVLVSARLAEYLRRRRKRRNPALDRLDPRLSCRPPQPANSRNPLPHSPPDSATQAVQSYRNLQRYRRRHRALNETRCIRCLPAQRTVRPPLQIIGRYSEDSSLRCPSLRQGIIRPDRDGTTRRSATCYPLQGCPGHSSCFPLEG
ncbi:hypothetical protein SAMN04244573_04645 [Azotobacter beijerinckii]|uniref:Uncharacterized protein n=1 Tax=Azotobacter beijerinckii TaxID=170623 RepID=A0A1H9TDP1_9GAMM|nr:hypothetical protein SAMN04244573_04645 [Azotobacter beijerinckii]